MSPNDWTRNCVPYGHTALAALQLVHLYAKRGSPKYEKAAMRWLERYLVEGSPSLKHFAEITTRLSARLGEPN